MKTHAQFPSTRSNSRKVSSGLHLGPERVLSYSFCTILSSQPPTMGLQGQLTQ